MIVYFHIFHALFSTIKACNVFLYIRYLCINIDKYEIKCYALPHRTVLLLN
jgi:hypothetical protein